MDGAEEHSVNLAEWDSTRAQIKRLLSDGVAFSDKFKSVVVPAQFQGEGGSVEGMMAAVDELAHLAFYEDDAKAKELLVDLGSRARAYIRTMTKAKNKS